MFLIMAVPEGGKYCGRSVNPLSANPTKWSNTLKQFVGQFADELFVCVWPFCEIGT